MSRPRRISAILNPLFSLLALRQRLGIIAILTVLLISATGCSILGVAAYKFAPAETIKPKYTNLAGQSVGVMVYADRGLRIDWPTLSLDLADSIQNKLVADQKTNDKPDNTKYALHQTTFPYPAASIVRYQQDHPEIEAMPIDQVAPRLGVSRLIYVDLQSFATRSDMAVDLYRGQATANIKIYEITNGHATLAQEWPNVTAIYPPQANPDGEPNIGDARTYMGTVDAFGTEVSHLFVPYQVERP